MATVIQGKNSAHVSGEYLFHDVVLRAVWYNDPMTLKNEAGADC